MPAFSPTRVACIVLLAALSDVTAADDEQAGAWPVTGTLGVVSDYVDRGVSQSDSHAAVQAEIALGRASGLYGKLWASTVDFDDGGEASGEVNYILGFERELGEGSLDANIAYIHYPGAASHLEYDLVELSAIVSQPVGPIDVSAETIFTPENAGNAGRGLYLALAAGRPLTDTLSLGMHVGRQWIEREDIAGPDYHDWGVALEWLHEQLQVVLRYADTDNDSCGDLCDARLIGEIHVSF